MRLVQTLVVRDEVDIVEAQIAFHLNAGVEFVIATDHESRDGTTEILESFAREGYLRRIAEAGEVREGAWRTRMARLAAVEHGADWVINTDADEFWMPRSGTLEELFASVPERYGVVWALSRHFPPRAGDERAFFAERMTVRVATPAAPINDPTSPYRPHAKAAHRADPDIVVRHGAHLVRSTLLPLRDWYVADVLHFPYRTLEQYSRKGVRRARGDSRLGQYVRALQAQEKGRIADVYRSLLVDDAMLERGRAAGSLVDDTRLRDALRSVRAGAAAGVSAPLDPADTMLRTAETAALREADVVRLARRLDLLGARVAALEEQVHAGRGSS